MCQKLMALISVIVICAPLTRAANPAATTAKLTAAEIVEKNVVARGGLQVWRGVQTMQWIGKMGVGGNQRATLSVPDPAQRASQKPVPSRPAEEVQLPFIMDLKRSRKMRFELEFSGKTAVQVYDGANGWKLRPFLNRLEVEPYTTEEQKAASEESDLDGPLVDYAEKGTRIAFDSMEKVDGRDTYKLTLTMKDGQTKKVWIDAQTFLEAKIEGQPRRLDGVMHPVEVYFRDYRQVDGLEIPYLLETKILPVAKTAAGLKDPPVPAEKIEIEKVSVNPKLADSLFTKPVLTAGSSITGPTQSHN